MALIKRKPSPTVTSQLEVVQYDLEDKTVEKADEASELATLAAEAKAASFTAATQAEAVAKARAILADAGVSL